MQFLSLYTPNEAPSGPPSMEHMQAMGALMEKMFASGLLKATTGVMNRSTGMEIILKDGKFTVQHGDIAGSSLMPCAGWAWMEANSREELAEAMREFLEVAGGGRCEIIQLMTDMPEM